MNKSTHIIFCAFLLFNLSLFAQTGILITQNSGDTQLLSGTEFSFTSLYDQNSGQIRCGQQSISLSQIAKIEPFPLEIINGNSENDITTPMITGLQFVGIWNGANHTDGTRNTPHPGTWEFHNDGTFSWKASDVKGQDMEGTWKYDPESKLIITSSFRCPALSVISEFDDIVVLKNETYNQIYSLSRESSQESEVSLNSPHITLFRPDGFNIRVSFVNHHFINQPTYKFGVAYSFSDNPNEFKKIYAAKCEPISFNYEGEWKGMIGGFEWESVIGGDIQLSELNIDDKLILRPFAEFADGKEIYGETLKIKVINPPANGIFLGEKLVDGKAVFWYNKGLKTVDETFFSTVAINEIPAVLRRLGEGWEVPQHIPRSFRYRYKKGSYSGDYGELNLFAPINNVSGMIKEMCSVDRYRTFFVQVNGGNNYYLSTLRVYSFGISFDSTLSTTSNSTSACLLPCKRIKVTW